MARESPYAMVAMETATDAVLRASAEMARARQDAGGGRHERDVRDDCRGRVLAEDVAARVSLPPRDVSIKDGYAVRHGDAVPGRELRVVGRMVAGRAPELRVTPGTAVYVTTGAPLPAGADAVLQVEDTEAATTTGDERRIRVVSRGASVRDGASASLLTAGHDVRRRGIDIACGDVVLPRGTLLGPAELGVLVASGVRSVPVHDAPTVGVLSTGDELVDASSAAAELGDGQVYDSNRAVLLELLRAMRPRVKVVDLGIARDDDVERRVWDVLRRPQRRRQRHAADDGAVVDVLVTSGGVSMGATDMVKPTLARAGTLHFGRCRMKPGKPACFASGSRVSDDDDDDDRERARHSRHAARWMAFGLPGNPASAAVCFHLFVAPALRVLCGLARERATMPRVRAVLAHACRMDPERPEYVRAKLAYRIIDDDDDEENSKQRRVPAGHYVARTTGRQASSRPGSLIGADALLLIAQGSGEVAAGTLVDAFLLDAAT